MRLFSGLSSGLWSPVYAHRELAFGVVVHALLVLVLQDLCDVVVVVIRLVLFGIDDVLREAVKVRFRRLVHVLHGRGRVYDLVNNLF